LIDIFPSLELCEGRKRSWHKLSEEIADFREDSDDECFLRVAGERNPRVSTLRDTSLNDG